MGAVLFLTISATNIHQKCQNFLEAFEQLQFEEKENFFKDDDLVKQHEICKAYVSFDYYDDSGINSDFGIENEVDYHHANNFRTNCENTLQLFSAGHWKGAPIEYEIGKWMGNKRIRSYRNNGHCCFSVSFKYKGKIVKTMKVKPRAEVKRMIFPKKKNWNWELNVKRLLQC